MDEDNVYVQLDLDIEDVHFLYRSVCFHLEKWSGGDPGEQEHLYYMKDFLYRIVLEYKFEHMD